MSSANDTNPEDVYRLGREPLWFHESSVPSDYAHCDRTSERDFAGALIGRVPTVAAGA